MKQGWWEWGGGADGVLMAGGSVCLGGEGDRLKGDGVGGVAVDHGWGGWGAEEENLGGNKEGGRSPEGRHLTRGGRNLPFLHA